MRDTAFQFTFLQNILKYFFNYIFIEVIKNPSNFIFILYVNTYK